MKKFEYGIGQVVTLKSKDMIESEFGIDEDPVTGGWICMNTDFALPSAMHEELYGMEIEVDSYYCDYNEVYLKSWCVSPDMCMEVIHDELDTVSLGVLI